MNDECITVDMTQEQYKTHRERQFADACIERALWLVQSQEKININEVSQLMQWYWNIY